MNETNITFTASLEGCLPEEFILKCCRHCGAFFELGADYHETLCPDCKRKIQFQVKQSS